MIASEKPHQQFPQMSNQSLRVTPPNEIRRLSGRVLHDLRMAIPAGKIVRRLGGFAVGAWETVRTGAETYEERPIEMNANQVRAAIALLNKVMPDLQSVQMEMNVSTTDEMTTDQLRARLRSIVAEATTVDAVTIQNTNSKNDLLSLDGPPGTDDLLAL